MFDSYRSNEVIEFELARTMELRLPLKANHQRSTYVIVYLLQTSPLAI
jgi:hypothetical protein